MADYIHCCRGTHPYASQEGIFRPYNFLSNPTNHTVYPKDHLIQ